MYALGFSAGKGCRRLAKPYVAETDLLQYAQALRHFPSLAILAEVRLVIHGGTGRHRLAGGAGLRRQREMTERSQFWGPGAGGRGRLTKRTQFWGSELISPGLVSVRYGGS